MTNKISYQMNEVVENASMDINTVITKCESLEKKVKFAAFGKTRASNKRLGKEKENQEESQKDKDIKLLKRQSAKIESEINKITSSNGGGRVGNVFKMRKMIAGQRKDIQEPTAIKDPETDKIVMEADEIKKVTLQYCVNNLKSRNPVMTQGNYLT